MVTIVRRKDGNAAEEIKIATHIVNQAQFLQGMSAFPNLGQLLGGAQKPAQSGVSQ